MKFQNFANLLNPPGFCWISWQGVSETFFWSVLCFTDTNANIF